MNNQISHIGTPNYIEIQKLKLMRYYNTAMNIFVHREHPVRYVIKMGCCVHFETSIGNVLGDTEKMQKKKQKIVYLFLFFLLQATDFVISVF